MEKLAACLTPQHDLSQVHAAKGPDLIGSYGTDEFVAHRQSVQRRRMDKLLNQAAAILRD